MIKNIYLPDHVLTPILLCHGKRAGAWEWLPFWMLVCSICTILQHYLSFPFPEYIVILVSPGSELTSSSPFRPSPSTCFGRETLQEVTEF